MTGGPLFVSSGKMIADRHYRSALERVARGDLADAAEILARIVELAPDFATAWFAPAVIRDEPNQSRLNTTEANQPVTSAIIAVARP